MRRSEPNAHRLHNPSERGAGWSEPSRLRSTRALDRRSTPRSERVRPPCLDYHRDMPQYQKLAEERIVTREELERGYLERAGLVVRKRRYELIRELPDGRFLVRAPQPEQP